MIVHADIAQGTPEWLALRLGIPTASCFDQIITTGGKKGEPKASTQAEKYMYTLLAERMMLLVAPGTAAKTLLRLLTPGFRSAARGNAGFILLHR